MQKFVPPKTEPKRYQIAAFDTEGDGIRGPICGALAYGDCLIYREGAGILANLADWDIRHNYRVYAHNLMYDLGVLYPYLPENSKLYCINGDIYRGYIPLVDGDPLSVFDSARLFAFLSLDELGRGIGISKFPTPPQLLSKTKEVEEWYCEEHNTLHCVECYVKRDALTLLKAVEMFQDVVLDLGGQLKNTLASTSMDLYSRKYLPRWYYTPFEHRNEYARKAYHGGWVEAFARGTIEHVNAYDFNSLYPSVMHDYEYPHPNYLIGPTQRLPSDVIDRYEGVVDVTVRVPDMHYPPLPYLYDHKLYFPTGNLRGVWTTMELRYAQSLGVEVLDLHEGLISRKTCRPFRKWVEDLYSLRLRLKSKGDPSQKVIKVLLNSLYGKFGQTTEAGLEKLITFEDWDSEGMVRGAVPVLLNGRWLMRTPITFNKQADYINVLWAAYVTAYGRRQLHQAMCSASGEVFYCDTDSLYIHGELPTSTSLGALKLQYEDATISIYGPKLYYVESEKGEVVTKAKGVPKDSQWEYLVERGVSYVKPLGFLEAAIRQASPSEWVEVKKVMRLDSVKRRYDGEVGDFDSIQRSRPLHVSGPGFPPI